MESSNINKLAKISFIGYPAVGKTTMLKLLSKDNLDKMYIPTQGFDLKTVKLGKYHIKVWDHGGQTSYLSNLEDYLAGSDIVFIVTDSTPRNVLNSKKLIEITNKLLDDECPIIAIANKQDLCKNEEGRMSQKLVEDLLQIKTFGLTAINSTERLKLLKIIENELNQILKRRELERN